MKPNKKIYFIIISFSLLLFFSFFLLTKENKYPNHLKVHYIDVGQGDATLIEFYGKNILIDTGPNSSEEKLLRYLKNSKIRNIHYVFISHPHEDHIGNLDSILNKFSVGTVLMPKYFYNSPDLISSIKIIRRKNINLTLITNNLKIFLGNDAYINLLSSKKNHYENVNDISPLIKLVFKEHSFIFPGDNESIGETEFLNSDIDIDVLKVGHHGSNTSSTDSFLEKTSPKIAIISCGKNNKFNHPNPNTLERILKFTDKIYRTDQDGSIVISSFGNSTIKIEKK